jgi:hypothetical protein
MFVHGKFGCGMLVHGMLVHDKLVNDTLDNAMLVYGMVFCMIVVLCSPIAMPFPGLGVPQEQA